MASSTGGKGHTETSINIDEGAAIPLTWNKSCVSCSVIKRKCDGLHPCRYVCVFNMQCSISILFSILVLLLLKWQAGYTYHLTVYIFCTLVEIFRWNCRVELPSRWNLRLEPSSISHRHQYQGGVELETQRAAIFSTSLRKVDFTGWPGDLPARKRGNAARPFNWHAVEQESNPHFLLSCPYSNTLKSYV